MLAAIASGRLRAFDATGALAMPGVLAVLGGVTTRPFGTENFELALFTSDQITYRGQLVGAVVADTLENARAAAAAVRVGYRAGAARRGAARGPPAAVPAGEDQPGAAHRHRLR